MAKIQDDDCLLVGRDGVDYRVSFKDFSGEVNGGPAPDAYTKAESDAKFMPLDLTTLPTL